MCSNALKCLKIENITNKCRGKEKELKETFKGRFSIQMDGS